MRQRDEGGMGQPVRVGQILKSGMAGSISAITGVDIDWIKTLHGNTWQTLYEAGTKITIMIPVGVSWELHVQGHAFSDAGGWAMACSIVSSLGKQCLVDRKVTGGAIWTKEFGFSMGAMPGAGVTISSVKWWVSEFYTTDKPPEADW